MQPRGRGSGHGWNFTHTHIRGQRKGGEERTDAQERADRPGFCSEAWGGSPSSTRVLSFPHLVWSPHVGTEPEKRCRSHDSLFSPKKSLRRRNIPELSPFRARGGRGGTKMFQRSVGMLRARAHQSRLGLRFTHAWHRLDLEDSSPGA